jgi:RNA polymerase sigma-70 factor (ECF subfamily)
VINPAELEAELPYLQRYALAQLRDRDAANEVVQETVLAALESGDSFSGKSSLRTWLTSILRFKLIDRLRRKGKEVLFESLEEETDDSDFDGLFSKDGHWQDKIKAWSGPEESLMSRQFWEVFERCSEVMPRRTAMAFVMREVMGLEIAEICNNLDITATNCSVLLYRARMSLRECFEIRWTGRPGHEDQLPSGQPFDIARAGSTAEPVGPRAPARAFVDVRQLPPVLASAATDAPVRPQGRAGE